MNKTSERVSLTKLVKKGNFKFIYLLLLFSGFLFLLYRSFYSFCWSDEGFYLSTVHNIINGNRMFIDDWSPTQFYVPLLIPFYYIYKYVFKGLDGIYLAARITQLFFHFLITLFFFVTLKKKYNSFLIFVSSILFLFFLRANIYGFSYYALSLDFYLLGILLAFNVFELHKHKILLFLSGCSFACSILCNPYIIFAYIAASTLILTVKKTRSHILLFLYIWAGTLFFALFYILYLLQKYNLRYLTSSFLYIFSDPEYAKTNKIKIFFNFSKVLFKPYLLTFYPFIFLCIISLSLYFLKNKNILPICKIVFLINLPIFLINCFLTKDIPGAEFVALFILSIPCFICIITHTSFSVLYEKKDFFYFYIPGILLAISYHYASNTGFSVFPIGFAVSIASSLLIFQDCCKIVFKNNRNLQITFTVFITVICLFFSIYKRCSLIYRDGNFSQLSCRISQGPAKGLYTTSINKDDYDSVVETMKLIAKKRDKFHNTIFISKLVPWAYLCFNGTCAAPSTWRNAINSSRLRTYYTMQTVLHAYPDFVLVVNDSFPTNDKNPCDGWFYENHLKKEYTFEKVPCGTLFIKNRRK